MIIFNFLASLVLNQSGIITTHPLGVTVVDPVARDFYSRPIGTPDCTTPTNVRISLNTGAYPSGALAIYLQAGSSCTLAALPVPPAALYSESLGNISNRGAIFFPNDPVATPFTTRTVLDVSKLCADGATPANLVGYILCVTAAPTSATTFIYDQVQFRVDTAAPSKVSGVSVSPGNGRLSVGYAEDQADASISSAGLTPSAYRVFVFEEDGTTLKTQRDFPVATGGGPIEGLDNGVTYLVRVSVTDIAGNTSELSDPAPGTPVQTCDFWSCYEGREQGGFCFIATAAYGSYDAPFVQTFRDFRDQVLAKTGPGRVFVRWYYKNGAAPAIYIAQRPWLRSVVASMLLIPYIAVWPLVHLRPVLWTVAFLAFATVVFFFARRGLKVAGLAVLLLLVGQTSASAEETLEREDPFDPGSVRIPPPRVEFAVKIGPYFAAIDRDADAGNRYQTFFGDTSQGDIFSKGSRIRFQLSADVYVFKKFGLLGFNGTVGFWEAIGKTRVCPTADVCTTSALIATAPTSGDATVLNLFPVSLSIVYKFDVFWRKWRVPLVPFVRIGADAILWNVQAAGRQARKDFAGAYKITLEPNDFAQGATYGWHVNPGLMLALDWIEPNAARSAYTFTGMKGSYLTFEWNFLFADDFGSAKSWDLSGSTFLAGLAVEF